MTKIDEATGRKAIQTNIDEDRSEEFKRFRFDNKPHESIWAMDVDYIEYVFEKDGSIRAIGVFELTCIKPYHIEKRGLKGTLRKIFRRIVRNEKLKRMPQGKFLSHVASCLGCRAYIVAFEEEVKRIHILDLPNGDNLRTLTQSEFLDWVASLRFQKDK